MTCLELLQWGKSYLSESGIADAATDAWYLFEYITGMNKTTYYMKQSAELEEEKIQNYTTVIEQRGSKIPLQHITGEQEFMGLVFEVSPHVLIPRQDTEILVEEALRYMKDSMSILDMCTGSGCIIISLLKHAKKKDLSAEAADISLEALAVASRNSIRHSVEVSFLESDLFENIERTFDMIISNPPYIRTSAIEELMDEVRLHEPFQALDGLEDGLYFYREIINKSGIFLNPKGVLLFEIGYDQGKDVSKLMMEAGYKEVRVIKDLAGLDRVVTGRK